MENFNKILSSFYIQDELNPTIWTNPDNASESRMDSDVRKSLLVIANEFIEFLGIEIFVSDITMTGSLANYNWSDFSDIDLHIMYDFTEAGTQKDLYQELFKLKKTLFNSTHDITVKGYEVELYVQDTTESHFSTGVYSVLYDEWIAEPSPESVTIDEERLKEKVEQWMEIIDNIMENAEDEELDDALQMIDSVKDKLKKFRSCGLEREGEYSYENLVFKFLRRNGYIQKLFDFTNELMDKRLSLEQEISE
jgi:predicted nucleotidyltransferase